MIEALNVTTERVDDILILLAHSDKMGVPELLDEYFKPHGNWESMSLGWTTAIWLTHIMSERDHRMNQVQGRAVQRVQTWSICSGQEVSERNFRDERLALVYGFGRLKGQPLSPMYVQSDQRAIGLVRLLSISLRVLTLLGVSGAPYLIWTKR